MLEKMFTQENCAENYLEAVRIMNKINEINFQLVDLSKMYFKDGCDGYTEHLKSLVNLKSPMDALELNRKYMQNHAENFQQLTKQRHTLFLEFIEIIKDVKLKGFALPKELSDLLDKFKDGKNFAFFKPEYWSTLNKAF